MTARTAERLEALSCILVDGLSYSWFQVAELDEKAVTATVFTDEDDEGTFEVKHEIGPDDVARGLRMYREWLEGKREAFPGEWKYAIDALLRNGVIKDESEFNPLVHARADEGSYGWQTVVFDRTNGEDGDYDANTADNVIQFAVFGQVIYG